VVDLSFRGRLGFSVLKRKPQGLQKKTHQGNAKGTSDVRAKKTQRRKTAKIRKENNRLFSQECPELKGAWGIAQGKHRREKRSKSVQEKQKEHQSDAP